ncbi:hypothetical protein [Aestuariivirga sp.]|uniref:hypothetical protein n=1 Tax=Aestuariivirga sp. TaxID=2650926 RepID=UPI003918C4E1
MEAFIYSGRIADTVLVVLSAEVALVGFLLWRRSEAFGLLSFVASALALGSIVLALRAALLGAGGLFVAIYLGAGLLAHGSEIALRVLATRHADGVSSEEKK